MTFDEIKKYLYDYCIVRNEEFEYKFCGDDMYCREIGTIKWNNSYNIGEYEKEMEWEIVATSGGVKGLPIVTVDKDKKADAIIKRETDLLKTKQLLDSFKVEYTEIETDIDVTITMVADTNNVDGYSGFYAEYAFTKGGTFKNIGIWE